MSFNDIELQRLEDLLAHSEADAGIVATFRGEFPGKSITRCDVSDMDAEQPYREFEKLDLYLVDGRDHCWRITNEPEMATGVVLAQHGKRRRSA